MLHAGAFIQDVMSQYGNPRPWILLKEGGDNTYVSSAMPQKRNPGKREQQLRQHCARIEA
jgi:argininosuccinate lyase